LIKIHLFYLNLKPDTEPDLYQDPDQKSDIDPDPDQEQDL